jgi:hypothetical protein
VIVGLELQSIAILMGGLSAYSIRRTLKAESVAPQEKAKAITACRLNPTASLDADPIFSFPFWFGEKILCSMRF